MSFESEQEGYEDRKNGYHNPFDSRRDCWSSGYDFDYDHGYRRADAEIAEEESRQREIEEHNRRVDEKFKREHPNSGDGGLSDFGCGCLMIVAVTIGLSYALDITMISSIIVCASCFFVFKIIKYFLRGNKRIKSEFMRGYADGVKK